MASYTPSSSPSSATTQDLKGKAADAIDSVAEKVSGTARDMAHQAGQVASRAAEQARDVGGKVQEVSSDLKGAVNKSLKDQPMATLAGAAVIGFLLGAIWKR